MSRHFPSTVETSIELLREFSDAVVAGAPFLCSPLLAALVGASVKAINSRTEQSSKGLWQRSRNHRDELARAYLKEPEKRENELLPALDALIVRAVRCHNRGRLDYGLCDVAIRAAVTRSRYTRSA